MCMHGEENEDTSELGRAGIGRCSVDEGDLDRDKMRVAKPR